MIIKFTQYLEEKISNEKSKFVIGFSYKTKTLSHFNFQNYADLELKLVTTWSFYC